MSEKVHQPAQEQGEQESNLEGLSLKAPPLQLTASSASTNPGNVMQLQDDRDSGIPEGGTALNKPGIVAWDGSPVLRLRSSPDTSSDDNITGFLPFNMTMEVVKEFPGDWYFVSTENGLQGYVAKTYVKTNLPEPGAKLHKVEGGPNGYAINIAQQYYGDVSDNFGQDNRFYVNVLAMVNGKNVPNTTDGWQQVQFQADDYIWVPSHAFAQSMVGVVNSGSYSWNALDAVGLAGIVDGIEEKIKDFRTAISMSNKYIGEAMAHYAEEAIMNALIGLATMIIGAVAILAITTAIGAGIGALAGGVGAAPGAAAGFEVGLALLEWLGLGFLVVWVGQKLIEVGGAFAQFIGTVWGANGDQKVLDQGAKEFADAIGRLLGAVIEGLIMFGAAKGTKLLFSSLKGTPVGKKFGESNAGRWLSERSGNVANGRGPIPGTSVLTNPKVGDFAGLKNAKVSDVLARIPKDATPENWRPIPGGATHGAKYKWVQDGVTWRARLHGPDASAPPGSNASKGWIFRVQKGNKYMDSNGTFHRPGVNNTRSPHYDPVLANDTHIPITKDVNPASLLDFHPGPVVGPMPSDTEGQDE